MATLYRNFPSREDLAEAVYVTEVDELCRYGERLDGRGDPWDALVSWLRRFVTYLGTKRVLLDALDRESGAFRACRDALYATGDPLLARAQQAGRARAEVTIDDVLRFFLGVTSAPVNSRRQRTDSWRWRSPGSRPERHRERGRASLGGVAPVDGQGDAVDVT